MTRLAAAWLVCAFGVLPNAGCWESYHIEAGDRDGADAPRDSGPDVELAGCPIFAVPEGSRPGPGSGARHDPFVGLQTAADERGECTHIILLSPAGAGPFAAGVVFDFTHFPPELLLEGDPAEPRRAELDARGGPGLSITGMPDGVTLRHLAVRNGSAPRGGCLVVPMDEPVGTLELDDTEWTGCSATQDGGAVVAGLRGELTVVDSLFRNNTAGANGGALAFGWDAGPLEIRRSTFQRNRAGTGGAVWVQVASDLTVADSRFADNTAEEWGGAIMGTASGELRGNRFERNRARYAAAIRLASGDLTVVQNVLADNGSENAPALWASGQVAVVNNLILRNLGAGAVRLGSEGGMSDSSKSVRNNVFAGNEGDPAHLFFLGRPYAEVAGNIFVQGAGDGTVDCGDSPGEPPSTVTVRFNDFRDSPEPRTTVSCAADSNLEVDPLFRDATAEDFRLSPGSPCIDVGPPGPLSNDADGTRNDIGAFGGPDGEWTPLAPTPS